MKAASAQKPFLCTSIGKKYVMGISALVWLGFVLAHMAGNLLIFISPAAYNKYGHALTSGYIIYAAEAVLILALIAHVGAAIRLTFENKAARGPERYAMTPSGPKGVSLASQTMAVHGMIILVFIILHLASFKYGTYYETTVDGIVMRDLHRLVIELFKQPGYVAWYAVAMIFLFFHLSHGVKSVFQSFGLKTEMNNPMIEKVSIGYAVVVAGGFLSQPIYCFLVG